MSDAPPPGDNPYQAPQDDVLVRPVLPAGAPGYSPPINVPALLSLILSILGIAVCQVIAIGGVICGHVALSQIKREPGRYNSASKGLAIAGTIVGYVALAILLLVVVGYSVFGAFMYFNK